MCDKSPVTRSIEVFAFATFSHGRDFSSLQRITSVGPNTSCHLTSHSYRCKKHNPPPNWGRALVLQGTEAEFHLLSGPAFWMLTVFCKGISGTWQGMHVCLRRHRQCIFSGMLADPPERDFLSNLPIVIKTSFKKNSNKKGLLKITKKNPQLVLCPQIE